MAANPSRRGWFIQNQSTGDLYVGIVDAATLDNNALKIPAGASYESPITMAPVDVLNIIGAATGPAFFAREW